MKTYQEPITTAVVLIGEKLCETALVSVVSEEGINYGGEGNYDPM